MSWQAERGRRRKDVFKLLQSLCEQRGLLVVSAEVLNDTPSGPVYIEVAGGSVNAHSEKIGAFDVIFQNTSTALERLPEQGPGVLGAVLGLYLRPLGGEPIVRCLETERLVRALSGTSEHWRGMSRKIFDLTFSNLSGLLPEATGGRRDRLVNQLRQISGAYTSLCLDGELPEIDRVVVPAEARHLDHAFDERDLQSRLADLTAYIRGLSCNVPLAIADIGAFKEKAFSAYKRGCDCSLQPATSVDSHAMILGDGWKPIP